MSSTSYRGRIDGTSPDFERLFRLARGAALRVKNDKEFAADVAQDVMEKLVVHPSRLPFAEAFVQQAAKNRAVDLVRGPRGKEAVEFDENKDYGKPADRPMRMSEQVAVRDAIRDLNPKLAEALLLYESGYRAQEVADKLGVAPGTVRNWLVEARRALSDILNSSPDS